MSPATDRAYSLPMVCATWRVARSSVYELRAQVVGEQFQSRTPGKRGRPEDGAERRGAGNQFLSVTGECPLVAEWCDRGAERQ